FLADWVQYDDDVTKEDQLTLCDAQTSGGLLAAVAPEKAEELVSALKAKNLSDAAVIGKIEAGPTQIRVSRTSA
ncbi:MAG: hypothetical protein KDA84_16540, partial [Planctomycetaceae bacterium]|nr:hypothetical protein [Planctomycetaceae bacterium]